MDDSGLISGREPLAPEAARMLPTLTLAYVGDAVYELFVREGFAREGGAVRGLHERTVKWVAAMGQTVVWAHIQDRLQPDEADVARRGRNVKSHVPKAATPEGYRRSTALESLLGYLYLTGRIDRLRELLAPALAAASDEIDGRD